MSAPSAGDPGLACPTCHRQIESEQVCPRCGTDLEMLHGIASAAQRLAREGWRWLQAGEGGRALRAFEATLRLRDTERARRGRVVALVAVGRPADAVAQMGRCAGV